MPHDALELLMRAPTALAAHGTARLWFHHEILDGEDDDDLSFGGEGCIEFARTRFRVADAAGDGGSYYFRMSPGDGWEVRGDPGDALDAMSPFWLIELVRGVASASELEADSEAGERLVGYACVFDLVAADRASERQFRAPGHSAIARLLAIPGEAWLDSAGCLRRASARLETFECSVRLDGLGEPGPVELPEGARRIW